MPMEAIRSGTIATPRPAATRFSIDVLGETIRAVAGTNPRFRHRSITTRANPPRSRYTADTNGSRRNRATVVRFCFASG